MLTDEQWLLLKLGVKAAPWSLVSQTLNTVAGQTEYDIVQPVSGYTNSGKLHHIIRATGESDYPYLHVPFDDFSEMNYGQLPGGNTVNSLQFVAEKVSVYRAGGQEQTIRVVINPSPQSVLNYTLWFFAGSVDRSQALMTQRMAVAEVTDYINLKSAMALLPYCQWREDDVYNEEKKRTLAAGLQYQLSEFQPVFEEYIRNINAPRSFDMGMWDGR
jgi:hypothetical protein